MRQRYLRMENQKPVPGLEHNQNFAIGDSLNLKLKSFQTLN